VLEECRKIGGCKTGQAVITAAGKLKAKRIIHTPGPIWRGGKNREAQLLENSYRNSFLLAKKHNLRTIAFPAISTGVYGYPIEDATKIALSVAKQFERDFDEIRFICFSEVDLEIYQRLFTQMVTPRCTRDPSPRDSEAKAKDRCPPQSLGGSAKYFGGKRRKMIADSRDW